MKIAINKCYGGFGLSPKANQIYLKKMDKKCFFYKQTGYAHNGNEEYTQIDIVEATTHQMCIYILTKDFGKIINKLPEKYHYYETFYKDRNNKLLIETIEELGEKEASGNLASIKIIEIPDDVEWTIDDYDGIESIHENHRSW